MQLSLWGLAKGYDCNIMDIKEANELGEGHGKTKNKTKQNKKNLLFILRYNLYSIRVKKNKVLSFIT